MRSALIFLLALAAFGADDPWAKVKELRSGAEIRVYKRGAAQPLTGTFDELRDDDIVVVIKHEQSAIPKDQIMRLDARPQKPASRMKTETQSKTQMPDARSSIPEPRQGPARPSTSTSTNVTFGSKPDFETIYRRTPGAPPANAPEKK
ncbi:MAG: hypothetical protein LAQ30_18155 [Acidobacteriia bacterium]|nr:hypothetical protein [Terriglobia bacterium]